MRTLVLATVIVGLVSVLKDPNAGIKGDTKSNTQGREANPHHDAATTSAEATTSAAVETTPPQPVINRDAGTEDQKAAHHDARPADSGPAEKFWLNPQFWFNLLLVIFTGLLTLFAFRQLKIMSGQLLSMTTALKVLERAEMLLNRVTVVGGQTASYFMGPSSRVHIVLKNTGRSRADGLVCRCTLSIRSSTTELVNEPISVGPIVVEQSGIAEIDSRYMAKIISDEPVDDPSNWRWNVWNPIVKGSIQVIVHCDIAYVDVFNQPHHTAAVATFSGRDGTFTIANTEVT